MADERTLDLVDLVRRWAEDPEAFVREAIRPERIARQQLDGLAAMRDLVNAKRKRWLAEPLTNNEATVQNHIGLSIMGGKGGGKTTFSAWMVLWFLLCFPRPKIACTAPTQHQLRDILWGEIAKWMRFSTAAHAVIQSGFDLSSLLTWQSERVYLTAVGGREWYAVARTANPQATAAEQMQTLSGFHEDYLLIVAEEAASSPDAVFAQLEDTLTGPVNLALIIFNPTRRAGFAIETQRRFSDRWSCLRWNAEDSDLVTEESLAHKAHKYGRESNAYRVNVLGLPPQASSDAVIPYDWVMECVELEGLQPLDTDVNIAGVDVGGGGEDPSVYVLRHGPLVLRIDDFRTDDSEALTRWLLARVESDEVEYVFIDALGVGWGVAGNLRQRLRGTATVLEVRVSEKSVDKRRFYRLRDELWWRMRERFERRGISIPRDDILIAELTLPTYSEDTGAIKMQSKLELRKQRRSPDRADALVLTEYYTDWELHRIRAAQTQQRAPAHNWKTV